MSPRRAVRLLLVGPHRQVHAAVERLIDRQKLPYALETAASPQEAVSRLRRAPCDAVLLDCTAGNGCGWQVFEHARHDPVILLVDRRANGAAVRAARRGACPYPVDTADESSFSLLPAVVENTLVWKRRLAERDARRHLGEAAHLERLSRLSTRLPELAHELSQPLSAIADYAAVCRHLAQGLGPGHRDELVDFAGRIAEQADRAGQIIRRLRDSARRADCPRAAVDVNALIRDLGLLLETTARPHDVRLELALGPDLPRALIDRIQIEQVVSNLVRNAVDAVEAMPPQRRVVTIRTSAAGTSAVEVAVEDQGRGVEKEEIERLFEPFYTRKADGMGLGLSISRWIVEAHGGRLEALPGAGNGTTFRFTLPAAEQGGKR